MDAKACLLHHTRTRARVRETLAHTCKYNLSLRITQKLNLKFEVNLKVAYLELDKFMWNKLKLAS